MGGKVLEHEAKDILREGIQIGRAEGRAEGRTEGILHTLFGAVQDGDMLLERGAKRANMSIDVFVRAMRDAGFAAPVNYETKRNEPEIQ